MLILCSYIFTHVLVLFFQQPLEVGIPIPKQSLKRVSLVAELDVAREGKKLGKAKASGACQATETSVSRPLCGQVQGVVIINLAGRLSSKT